MSSSTSSRSAAPSGDAAETNSPGYTVFTRGRTRRKMLRGAEKKADKVRKNKTGPLGEATPTTQNPSGIAVVGTEIRKRKRLRKPKQPTPSVFPRGLRKFQYEDKIIPMIPCKRAFQAIIDLTNFNGMGKTPKIRRNDRYVPGLLPDGNKEHEVNKAWEEWVKREFVKLCYPREFTPGPMLTLHAWVPPALANDNKAAVESSASGAPIQDSNDAQAWELTSDIKETPCQAGCSCWDCSLGSSQARRKGPQARSNTKIPQESNRPESRSSSASSGYEFVVPGGPLTWDSLVKGSVKGGVKGGKGMGVGPGKGIAGVRQQGTTQKLEQAQSREVQRERQLELVSLIRNTIQTAQLQKGTGAKPATGAAGERQQDTTKTPGQAQSLGVQRLEESELGSLTRNTVQTTQLQSGTRTGARQQDTTQTSERNSASPSEDTTDSKPLSGSRSSQKSHLKAQSHEVQRLRQAELVSQLRKTVEVTQSVKNNFMAYNNSRIALIARASHEPQEGHNTKHWERTRELMKEKGLFPTGAPDPPLWMKYMSPENAKRTHPNDWWSLNPEELALDPMYAEKIGKILEKFPEVRKWRGVLPPYPVPGKYLTLQGAQYIIPNLDELPKKVLLDYVEFVQQGDVRLNGPSFMKVNYDSELLLLYREVWNRRCATRESILSSLGIATTVGWAGGLMKVENVEDVKKLYPSLAPETVKWCALLVKGFCRMPLVIGLKPDVWHNPRYDNLEDRSAWP